MPAAFSADTIVPARFLTLLANLIILILSLWSRESNVIASLPFEYEEDDYNSKYKELTIGLSLGITLIGIEFIGFFSGITMFKNSISLMSIFLHGLASLATTHWLLHSWQTSSYWLIFLVCIFFPATVETITISTGWTFILLLTGIATIVGSSIPVGFTIGVVNTPSKIIKQWCNESVISRYGMTLSGQHLDNLWSAIVSIFLIGGMIGSIVGAWVADRVGRKGAMVVGGVMALISAIMFIACKPLNSVEIMLLGRFIAGLSGGLVTAVMPMYLTELAPINLRGATGTFCPLGLCLGVLLGQIMGLPFILGDEKTWNFLLGCYALLIVISGLSLPWLPESPKYLYTIRGLRQKAITELSKLRELPGEYVCGELEDKEEVSAEKWSVVKLICSRPLRLSLLLVCALQAGQQFSGINAVFYYSVNIFRSAGLSESNAQYASLGAGAINFLIALIMIPIINRFPRRLLAIGSCVMATACLVLLSFSINFMNSYTWMPYLSIVAVLSYVFWYGVGLGPIPYFIGSELFDLGPRPFAMALGSVSNWTGNFIVGMTFLELQHLIGPYSFLIFATITGLLAIFLKICLPETNALVLVKDEIRKVSLTAEHIERI